MEVLEKWHIYSLFPHPLRLPATYLSLSLPHLSAMMDCQLQVLTIRRLPPAPLKGFFRLPWELRQRVYELCLIEPTLWERGHVADCPLAVANVSLTLPRAFVSTIYLCPS